MSQPPQPGGHPFPPQPGGDPQQPGGYAQQGGYPPQGGYPQQQQFGQPYGAPQKNNKPLIFGAIGVLVIGIAVTLILVLTGGSGPRDTVEDFISGVQNKDIEAVNATICDEKRKMKPGVFERAKDLPQDIKILEVKEEGDTATVTLEATVRGERDTDNFTLRKKDGNWCIGSM